MNANDTVGAYPQGSILYIMNDGIHANATPYMLLSESGVSRKSHTFNFMRMTTKDTDIGIKVPICCYGKREGQATTWIYPLEIHTFSLMQVKDRPTKFVSRSVINLCIHLLLGNWGMYPKWQAEKELEEYQAEYEKMNLPIKRIEIETPPIGTPIIVPKLKPVVDPVESVVDEETFGTSIGELLKGIKIDPEPEDITPPEPPIPVTLEIKKIIKKEPDKKQEKPIRLKNQQLALKEKKHDLPLPRSFKEWNVADMLQLIEDRNKMMNSAILMKYNWNNINSLYYRVRQSIEYLDQHGIEHPAIVNKSFKDFDVE